MQGSLMGPELCRTLPQHLWLCARLLQALPHSARPQRAVEAMSLRSAYALPAYAGDDARTFGHHSIWCAGTGFGLPFNAAAELELGYQPHNPALDAAMRELQETMHRGRTGPGEVCGMDCPAGAMKHKIHVKN